MKRVSMVWGVVWVLGLAAGCPTDPTNDDKDGAVDASAGNAGADAGSTVSCPSVGGGYTWLTAPNAQCPEVNTSMNVRDTTVSQPGGGCTITFSQTTTDNRWPLAATVDIDENGDFPTSTVTLAGTDLQCSGDYTAGSPSQYAFNCGACTFVIRYGE